MGYRKNILSLLLACAALIAMASTAWAVSEADVMLIKSKLENKQSFSRADVQLAERINSETGSYIDMELVWALHKGAPIAEAPRQPRRPLDEYVVTETDFNWVDVVANGTAVPLADDAQTTITIPFAFPFYDETYTSAILASNGYLAFGTSPFSSLGNIAIPATTDPNGVIFMFWDDLDYDNGNAGNVYTYYDEANDRFIIQFNQVQHFPSGNPETFECILYENGNIILQYQTVSNAGSCTVGIENLTGTDGEQICFNNATCLTNEAAWLLGQIDGVPNPPSAVTATPNGSSVTFEWHDPTHDTNGNPLTPDAIEIWQGPAGSGTLLGTVQATVETFTTNDLASGNYTFSLRAQAGAYFSASVSVTAVVGNPSYFSDFEADNGNLVADNGWEWGTPTVVGPAAAHSGTNCWGTLLAANYANAACYNLDINQELTVGSDAATLEFWMWFQSEGFFDGMNIKVSTDGGTTWEIVTDVTPVYNEDAIYTGSSCIPDEVAWSSSAAGSWQYYVVNLGAYVGTTPIIRFSFGSDGSVVYPGFYIDDVTLWGFGEPVFAPVSGTVSLDGGAASVTSVSVMANGIGNPTTNPAANGAYSLPTVLVGNRVMTGTLAGYHTATQPFVLTEGGATNINLTLVRLDPPVPTGLIGSANNQTGLVTLDWDNSPDPLVDVYPVYRRLQGEQDWVLQGTPATSQFTQTLTVDGIYQYAVAARDNNVSTPVESEMTGSITVLYGALPVASLGANGNFDDRIVLNWLTPGISEGTELLYDDGTAEQFYVVAFPAGNEDYFCVRMTPPDDASYPLMLYSIAVFVQYDSLVPWMGICPPLAGGGADIANPLYEWTDMRADTSQSWLIGETDGSVFLEAPGDFYIAYQFPPGQITQPGVGSDNSDPDDRSYWTQDLAGAWNLWTAHDWMMRAWVGGPPPEELAGRGNHFEMVEIDGNGGYAQDRVPARSIITPALGKDKTSLLANAEYASSPGFANPMDQWFPPFSRAPELRCQVGREGRRSLDELTNYRVYRQGTGQIAQVAGTVNTYTDLNRIENTSYTYWVTAIYDGAEESPESPHVTATCNMAPGAPAALAANALGNTQMALAWTAPTTNADGSALVDLAGYRIYRDGVQIGTTAPGVMTYLDTPPDNQTFYTWTVTAIDEVPNVSAPSNNAIAAVVSPWEVVDYEWVDITNNGTVIVEGDDINSGLMDLPWDFEFYGQTHTQFCVCSNGWISFSSVTNSLGGSIPNTFEPNNTIAMNWMDLNPFAGGDVYMFDDVANDRLIISWVDVQQYANPANVYTMQMILSPPTSIYFYYQAVGTAIGTVGVENADGTDGIALWQNGDGAFQPTNESGVAFWAGPSGAIVGLVREFGTNIPLQGAEVTALEAPGELGISDAQGNYSLGVEPGTYTVTVHKQGYCDQIFEDVLVEDGGETTRNASLRQPAATFSSTSINIYTLIGQNSGAQFDITNPGGQCDVEYTITSNQTWLTTNPATGSVQANQTQTITLSGATSAFPAGDYEAMLTVTHNDNGSPYTIPVTITVALSSDENAELPTKFALHTNYPNPFNATTVLAFDVPTESQVDVVIYNVNGQEVDRPVHSVLAAGRHSVLYTANNLPTGMYLVKMNAGSFSAVQKMLLLK